MYHYVYRTTCIPNGKTYVGVRSSRCWPTEDTYLGSGTALTAAVRKYGRKCFSKQVLVIVETREEALRIEAALVTEAVAKDPRTYNRTKGGFSGPGYRIWTDSQKEALRRSMNRPERKAQLRLLNLGNQRRLGTRGSERQRQAVAAANRRRTG